MSIKSGIAALALAALAVTGSIAFTTQAEARPFGLGWGIGAAELVAELETRDIAASSRPPHTVRFVTHRQVGEAEADALVAALREISGR